MSNDAYEERLHDLDVRESFALAQGREDLVDEIERDRKRLHDYFARFKGDA